MSLTLHGPKSCNKLTYQIVVPLCKEANWRRRETGPHSAEPSIWLKISWILFVLSKRLILSLAQGLPEYSSHVVEEAILIKIFKLPLDCVYRKCLCGQ